jgi:hypothetical protein
MDWSSELEFRGQFSGAFSCSTVILELHSERTSAFSHGSFATASCIKVRMYLLFLFLPDLTSAQCGYRVSGDAIRPKIDAQEIPLCPKCHPDGVWAAPDGAPLPTPISKDTWKSFRKTSVPPHLFPAFMKPDIVFFGESLPREFHSRLQLDIFRADLVIVMGSSLRVQVRFYRQKLLPK